MKGGASDLLLTLYRAAREMETTQFQAFAIGLLRPVLRFQSAVWAMGYFSGPTASPLLIPVQASTLEIDPGALAYWKTINCADKVIPRILEEPGTTINFHAPTLFAARDDAVMRDYAKRFGRQSYMVTALTSKEATLFEWASFYRPDPNDQFTESERACCQALVRHLAEALVVNDLLQGTVRQAGAGNGPEFAALVDEKGRVLAAEEGFVRTCQAQWREFDGQQLPVALVSRLLAKGKGAFIGSRATLHGRRIAEYMQVTASVTAPHGIRLSPRQLEVSTLFADGLQAKEIAKIFAVSPSTVRNQLIASYRALQVWDRKGLREALARSRVALEQQRHRASCSIYAPARSS